MTRELRTVKEEADEQIRSYEKYEKRLSMVREHPEIGINRRLKGREKRLKKEWDKAEDSMVRRPRTVWSGGRGQYGQEAEDSMVRRPRTVWLGD
jgi:hypothetical protein